MTRIHAALVVCTLVLSVAALAGPARAETTLCTPITSLPTAITIQGSYCLTQEFSVNLATGNAIEIQTNNVVIDLNGHKIGNLAAGKGTLAEGIVASGRQNITIRNGTIRGFRHAIIFFRTRPSSTRVT